MNLNSIADKLIFKALKNIDCGVIYLTNHDNKKYIFGSENETLKADIKIYKPRFAISIINKGSIGLAEAYMNGDFETTNLSNLIEVTAKNIDKIHKFSGVLDIPFFNFFKNIFFNNTKKRSKENIAKHYDLGNEFFSLWLDKSLTYSSAIFENGSFDLESAQDNKYQKLSSLLQLHKGGKILEIGCGWGGFAEHVGKKFDVKMDCITISKNQYEYAKKRIFKEGLNEKVSIKMQDYRDVKDKYNAIASIEMIEAVGRNYLDQYFKTIKKNLAQGGNAGIQAITIDDNLYDRYKKKEDFIQKYIFPGGFLPCKRVLRDYANDTGLEIKEYNSYGNHYSNTLKLWRNEFQKKWIDISKQGFDLTFKRMWNFYLSYCEAGFKSKNIDLVQFSLSNK